MSRIRESTQATGSVRRVFAIPAALAVVTALGLLSALLGDGIWNMASWLAMAVPMAVILRHLRRSPL